MATIEFEKIKRNLKQKYPKLDISQVISLEPDRMNVEEFLSKVGTWLAICDTESNKNEKNQVKKEDF